MKKMGNSCFSQISVTQHVNGYPEIEYRDALLRRPNNNEDLIRMSYATVNFKDLLKINGNFGSVIGASSVPGIDGVGSVIDSSSGNAQSNNKFIVSSSPVGIKIDGTFSEFLYVPRGIAAPLPTQMSEFRSMVLGTAGLTAAHVVDLILKSGLKPEDGKMLVNGGSTGVGFLITSILAHLGYSVTATIRSERARVPLYSIGASEVIIRAKGLTNHSFALLPERWVTVVDLLGGDSFSEVLSSLREGGVLYQIGNVAGNNLTCHAAVFYERSVEVKGIKVDSIDLNGKNRLWNILASDWRETTMSVSAFVKLLHFSDLKKYLQIGNSGHDFTFKTVVVF